MYFFGFWSLYSQVKYWQFENSPLHIRKKKYYTPTTYALLGKKNFSFIAFFHLRKRKKLVLFYDSWEVRLRNNSDRWIYYGNKHTHECLAWLNNWMLFYFLIHRMSYGMKPVLMGLFYGNPSGSCAAKKPTAWFVCSVKKKGLYPICFYWPM